MSKINKNSLKYVFLAESEKPDTDIENKTDKNVVNTAKKRDDKKIKDVNKELEDFKSILEGPFDDAFEKYLNSNDEDEDDKETVIKKLDEPFSNNLSECGLDMASNEHEAMETPEEEAMEHMDNGVVITIGHSADEKMEKTGQDAFNIGRKFGAPGGPNFKDGIDDELDEGKKASTKNKSTWQPPKKGVNPFPKKDNKTDDAMIKESVSPNRWKKLAGIIKENSSFYEPEDDLDSDELSDLNVDKPEWEEHFDNERESGSEMSNMSIEDLIKQGFSDEEILDIVKYTKTQQGLEEGADYSESDYFVTTRCARSIENLIHQGFSNEEIMGIINDVNKANPMPQDLKEVVDSDEDISGNTPDNSFENENEDLTMMQESFVPERWKKLAGITKKKK